MSKSPNTPLSALANAASADAESTTEPTVLNEFTYDPDFLEEMQAMFSILPPERQRQIRRLGMQNYEYIRSSRDTKLSKTMDQLCNNAAAALFGGSEKRRAMIVIGESDSGKSRALTHLVSKRPEFKPRRTPKGLRRPFVFFEAPKPLTIKGFASNALSACGYPVNNPRMTEQELFETLKEQIREKRVVFMWVDEMQHVLKGNSTNEIQNVSDIIKSLLQIPGWPLHMILSGVPALAQFLVPSDGDRQLRNRSFLVHLNKITKTNSEMMLKLQKHIMKKANVILGETDTPEFMERLTYSTYGAFGTMIKRMQCAAEEAVLERHNAIAESDATESSENPLVVTTKHYAAVYALETGATNEENLFIQKDWQNISPLAPLKDILDGLPKVEKRSGRKKGAA